MSVDCNSIVHFFTSFLRITVFVVLSFGCFFDIWAKRSANIKTYGLQVDLHNAVTDLGGVIYFTTYDGLSSTPLLDYGQSGPILSGELKPLSFGSSTFVTDYGTANIWGNIAEYGAVTLSMPTTDNDSNGVPDWLQINLSVNSNVSGFSKLHYIQPGGFSGDSTISGSFSRSAGSSSGNYNLIYTISGLGSITATGVWFVEYQSGTIEYDDTSYSINVSTKNSYGITEQSKGSSYYSIIDQDNIKLGEIFVDSPDGTVQLKETSLKRSGNSYVGYFQAIDGYPTTSWADYLNHYVEITDSNDADEDGVPDLTDPVDPFLATVGSDLGSGWRLMNWFGTYYPFSTGWTFHLDHGWIYSQSSSIDSFWFWHHTYNWCWTNQSAYPWVWFHDDQTWKYHFKTTAKWVTLNP